MWMALVFLFYRNCIPEWWSVLCWNINGMESESSKRSQKHVNVMGPWTFMSHITYYIIVRFCLCVSDTHAHTHACSQGTALTDIKQNDFWVYNKNCVNIYEWCMYLLLMDLVWTKEKIGRNLISSALAAGMWCVPLKMEFSFFKKKTHLNVKY